MSSSTKPDDDPVQSTGSVLGELIKDLDLPAVALDTFLADGPAQEQQQQQGLPVAAQFSLVQGADGTQEVQVSRSVSPLLSCGTNRGALFRHPGHEVSSS